MKISIPIVIVYGKMKEKAKNLREKKSVDHGIGSEKNLLSENFSYNWFTSFIFYVFFLWRSSLSESSQRSFLLHVLLRRHRPALVLLTRTCPSLRVVQEWLSQFSSHFISETGHPRWPFFSAVFVFFEEIRYTYIETYATKQCIIYTSSWSSHSYSLKCSRAESGTSNCTDRFRITCRYTPHL